MTKVLVLAGGVLDLELPRDYDLYVGVDAGAKKLLEAGLPLDLAVGDFDSVTQQEWDQIASYAKRVLGADAEKDDTDLELALLACFEYWPQASVTVLGALGGRLDHALANVFLPSNENLAPFMDRIELLDEQNLITYCGQGVHLLPAPKGWSYVAFLPVQDQELRIQGARYPLTEENYFFKKVYASNEFLDGPITLENPTGYVVVIFSKDRT